MPRQDEWAVECNVRSHCSSRCLCSNVCCSHAWRGDLGSTSEVDHAHHDAWGAARPRRHKNTGHPCRAWCRHDLERHRENLVSHVVLTVAPEERLVLPTDALLNTKPYREPSTMASISDSKIRVRRILDTVFQFIHTRCPVRPPIQWTNRKRRSDRRAHLISNSQHLRVKDEGWSLITYLRIQQCNDGTTGCVIMMQVSLCLGNAAKQ